MRTASLPLYESSAMGLLQMVNISIANVMKSVHRVLSAGSAANGLCLAGANEIDITLVAPNVAWDDHPAKAAMISELGELASGGATAAAEAKTSAAPTPDAAGTSDTPNLENTDPEWAATCNVTHVATVNAEAVGSEPGAATQDQETASSAAEADSCASPHVSTMKAVSALPKARTPVVKLTVSATQVEVAFGAVVVCVFEMGHWEMITRFRLGQLRQLVICIRAWEPVAYGYAFFQCALH